VRPRPTRVPPTPPSGVQAAALRRLEGNPAVSPPESGGALSSRLCGPCPMPSPAGRPTGWRRADADAATAVQTNFRLIPANRMIGCCAIRGGHRASGGVLCP